MQEETNQLKDYLRGMKRGNRKALAQLTAIADWPGTSQREIERRAGLVLNMLPDEILLGLATGAINMRETIADVLAE